MVWGCITNAGVGLLLRIDKNIKGDVYCDILRHALKHLPLLQACDEDEKLILQQDNASCHTSWKVEAFLNRKQVVLLPWPAMSPDINLLENVWANMTCSLRGKTFRNADELRQGADFQVIVAFVCHSACGLLCSTRGSTCRTNK